VPTALGRVIQQALSQVLVPVFDPGFSERSFGFRPGRSAHDAIRRAQRDIAEGHEWASIWTSIASLIESSTTR
jgi:RNA-directed DNA polymerase